MKKLLLIGCLVLAGCGSPQNSPQRHYTYKTVSYWRDARSETCYAVVESYYGGAYVETTTTNIPCTEKVIALTNYFSND